MDSYIFGPQMINPLWSENVFRFPRQESIMEVVKGNKWIYPCYDARIKSRDTNPRGGICEQEPWGLGK